MKKSSRSTRFVLFCLSILLFSTGGAAEVRKLALNWKAEPQFGGFYAADYKKHGLDVQIQEGGTGTPTLQMIQNKNADYAIVSGEEILIAKNKSDANSITAVFATYQESPVVIMTHPERNFTSIADVFRAEGILSVQSGLSYFLFLKKKYGEPKARVVPYSGGVNFFLNDKTYSQQGFLTAEPLLVEKAGKKSKNFLVSESGFRPYNTVVVVRTEFLKKNHSEVQKFVQATREGWQKYLDDPTSTNLAMAKINKTMDPETFSKSAALQKPLITTTETSKSGLGSMTQARWDDLLKVMKEIGLLKKDLQPKDLFQNL